MLTVQPHYRKNYYTLDSSPDSSVYALPKHIAMNEGLQIGEIAKRAGVSIDTLRYYEKVKLLPRAGRYWRLCESERGSDSTLLLFRLR